VVEDGKANTLPDVTNTTEPVEATPKTTEEQAGANGKPISQSHLSTPPSSFSKKHRFPASRTDDGDGSSSKFGSSIRRKHHSLFGRASEVHDEGSSEYGKRKKKLSLIQKVKRFFRPGDIKD